MAEYEFNYDEIPTPSKIMGVIGKVVSNAIAWFFFVASVIAVLFGIISWSALNKFRTFRNFALLSAIITYMLLALVTQVSDFFFIEDVVENNSAIQVIPLAFIVFFQMVYQFWLIVLCYVLSVDFVRVFHYDVRLKYLWANLFAWGVPFIIVLVYVIVGSVLLNKPGDDAKDIFDITFVVSLLYIPVALSLITYIAVVCRLFCGASTNNKCKGFSIVTLIFTISNVFLFDLVPLTLEKDIIAVDIVGGLLDYALIIALFVLIVILKGNWKLWREFINKKMSPESGVMLRD